MKPIKIIQKLNESVEDKTIYYFCVGVCYMKDLYPESSEDNYYDMPDFEIPYKLADENFGATKTAKEAVMYVKHYVANGIKGTFGVVIKSKVPADVTISPNDISAGWADWIEPGDIYHFKENGGELIYSAYSTKDGIKTIVDNTGVDAELVRYTPSEKVKTSIKNLYDFVRNPDNRSLFKTDGIDEDIVNMVKNMYNKLDTATKDELLSDLEYLSNFVNENKAYFHDSIDAEIIDFIATAMKLVARDTNEEVIK